MEGTFCVLLPCQVNSSLWSDGTPDAVSHSLGHVSGAADQDVEDSFLEMKRLLSGKNGIFLCGQVKNIPIVPTFF